MLAAPTPPRTPRTPYSSPRHRVSGGSRTQKRAWDRESKSGSTTRSEAATRPMTNDSRRVDSVLSAENATPSRLDLFPPSPDAHTSPGPQMPPAKSNSAAVLIRPLSLPRMNTAISERAVAHESKPATSRGQLSARRLEILALERASIRPRTTPNMPNTHHGSQRKLASSSAQRTPSSSFKMDKNSQVDIGRSDSQRQMDRSDSMLSARSRSSPRLKSSKNLTTEIPEVPLFYLKSMFQRPSQQEQLFSTAGFAPVPAFTPHPTIPNQVLPSKNYFAPKGLGGLECQECGRFFLSDELLAQHKNSTTHQYRLAVKSGTVQKIVPPDPVQINLLDCGEFDEAYHSLDSDDEHSDVSMTAEQKQKLEEVQRVREEKQKFFQYIRDHHERMESQELQYGAYMKLLQEEVEEAAADGMTLRAGRLRREMHEVNLTGTRTSQDDLQRTRSIWTPSPTEFSFDDNMDDDPIEALFRADRQREERERKAREKPPSPEAEPEPFVIPPDVPEIMEGKVVDERAVYLQRCKELGIPPKPSIVTRRSGSTYSMKHYGAGDKAVQALASGLKLMSGIKVINLRDNRIGKQGAWEIVEAFRDNDEVHTIDLANNQIGRLGVSALKDVMCSMKNLTSLDLSSNKLSDSEVKHFMEAGSMPTLVRLNMNNNFIASMGAEEIGNALIKNQSLKDLDLSWNAIRGKGAASFGKALEFNTTLETLNLAWNGVGGSKSFDVWAGMLEFNTTLRDLDLSHNNLDKRNAFIICEHLRYNEQMSRLCIDDNPIGPVGAKLLFKLMDCFGADSHTRTLSFENCNFDAKSKNCNFDPSECQGDHRLDLAMQYDRTIAMALVRIAGPNLMDQWRNPKLDDRPFDTAKLDSNPANLPRSGILCFTFHRFVARATADAVVNEKTFRQLQRLVGGHTMNDVDKISLLVGVAEDIAIDCDHLCQMLDDLGSQTTSNLKIQICQHLFSRLVDRENFEDVEAMLTKEEVAGLRMELGALWSYSDKNPTGHYRLNLARPMDRNLAVKILEVNNSERNMRKDNNLADTSDDGQFMNFRNETVDGKPFFWGGLYVPEPTTRNPERCACPITNSPAGWKIPSSGILEFDYVSTERPPSDAEPFHADYMLELMSELARKNISEAEKLQFLQGYAVEEHFSTEQVAKIARMFHEPKSRVDAVVMLHRKVIDLENFLRTIMETLRNNGVPVELGEDEVPTQEHDMEINAILGRLGWLNCWNPLDPDIMYRLDLSNRDQNLVAQCLVDLAVCEPGENWVGESLDGREFELPSTWVKQVPNRGFLEVHYHTDHTSDETIKSKLKRGDNFNTRLKWFKKTLIYQNGMEVEDLGYTGRDRETWASQRNWKLLKPASVKPLAQDLLTNLGHVRNLRRKSWVVHTADDGALRFMAPNGEEKGSLQEAMELQKEKSFRNLKMTQLLTEPSAIKLI